MSWLTRARKGIRFWEQGEDGAAPARRTEVPENLWSKCPSCGDLCYHKELEKSLWVCYQCGYHHPIAATRYFELLLDEGSFQETHVGLVSTDPLRFRDTKKYRSRLKAAQEKTGREEAVITALGTVGGIRTSIAVMDFQFLGGSMGSVVGEKIARAVKDAVTENIPMIIVSRSGGARMQESILSLMQLAKTSAMLARLAEANMPLISILTHPTTGGVTASFAMLGDVNIAEPKALIGFAGPRVIKQTINTDLPEGFQMSEFLLEHGMVDRIVARKKLREEVHQLLRFFVEKTDSASDGGEDERPAELPSEV